MQRWGIAVVAAALVLGVGARGAQAATWSVDDPVVTEGNSGTTQVTFTLTASGMGALESASVDYATVDGTATAPGDYTATTNTASVMSVLPGDYTTTVKVDVNGDTTPERDETFQLVLSNPSGGGSIGDGSGQATIVNDDAPHLHVTGSKVLENAGAAVFTVSLDGAAAASVHYATADGSAFAGSDYTAQSGTLTFARSDAAKTISVPLINDSVNEGDETFQLQLSDAKGVASSGNDLSATATIADDDAVVPLPTSGSSTTGSSVTADHAAPHVRLSKPRAGRGTIVVSITCPATEILCRGTLTTFAQRYAKLHSERRLGKAMFVIAGGRTAMITTRISKATLRLLRRAGRVKVRSYAVVRDAAGNVGTASAGALLRGVH
jgi:hypothetical protein